MSVSRSERKFWTTTLRSGEGELFVVRLERQVFATEEEGLWNVIYVLPPQKPEHTIGEQLGRPGHGFRQDWELMSTSGLSGEYAKALLEQLRRVFPDAFQEESE